MSEWTQIHGGLTLDIRPKSKGCKLGKRYLTTPYKLSVQKEVDGIFGMHKALSINFSTQPQAEVLFRKLTSKHLPGGENYSIRYTVTQYDMCRGSTNSFDYKQEKEFFNKLLATPEYAGYELCDINQYYIQNFNISDNIRYCTTEELVIKMVPFLKELYKRLDYISINGGTFRISGDGTYDYIINLDFDRFWIYAVNHELGYENEISLACCIRLLYSQEGFRYLGFKEESSRLWDTIINDYENKKEESSIPLSSVEFYKIGKQVEAENHLYSKKEDLSNLEGALSLAKSVEYTCCDEIKHQLELLINNLKENIKSDDEKVKKLNRKPIRP